jgi:hypothetical protein
MIKKVPIPMAGLSLGFAALGNLLQSYSETIRLICGAISAVLAILFLCKCIFHFDLVKEDMKKPCDGKYIRDIFHGGDSFVRLCQAFNWQWCGLYLVFLELPCTFFSWCILPHVFFIS